MENPKINNNSTPIHKKGYFVTTIQADLDLISQSAQSLLSQYTSEFPNIRLKEFIDDTYSEIKQWNLEGRLNGSVAFSGPLRYAFLAEILPRFAKEFPKRQLMFVLGEKKYEEEQFGPIMIHPIKEFTISPYLMDTNPYQLGYSGYLKRDK